MNFRPLVLRYCEQHHHQQQLLKQLLGHRKCIPVLASSHLLPHRSNKFRRCAHTSSSATAAAAAPVSMVSSPTLVQQTQNDSFQQQSLVFNNHTLAYGHRSLPYLLRAYFVLQLCRMQRLTHNASRWARLGARVLGHRLFGLVMKASFFGHFTGAEDIERVRHCVKTLYSTHKVRPILHYHAERELGECKTAQQRAEAVKWNAELTLESIKIVSEAAPDAFAAIKITAFFDPQVLAKLTSTIMSIRRLHDVTDSGIDAQQAKHILGLVATTCDQPVHVTAFKMMQNLVSDHRLLSLTDLSVLNTCTKMLPDQSQLFYQHIRPGTFTSDEHDELLASWEQLTHISNTARQLNVRLFIDAEQTWLQPAIGQFALLAMQQCNKIHGKAASPRVWGTLQCYLKDAEQTYREYNDIAKRENFTFATKFVRGAYIRSETDRAKAMQYECAIFPTYEATNENYDRLADIALRRVARGGDGGLQVAFATHNEKSIEKVLKQMRKMDIGTSSVAFGQLYGMCDRITYHLASSGYTVLKVVPYGPIPLLTPYFVRRAEENSLMLGRCEKDLEMLKMELARRLMPGMSDAKRARAAQ